MGSPDSPSAFASEFSNQQCRTSRATFSLNSDCRTHGSAWTERLARASRIRISISKFTEWTTKRWRGKSFYGKTRPISDRFVFDDLEAVLMKAHGLRTAKVTEELAVMRELPRTRLCKYDEVECRVCIHSTIRVKRVAYSVPARFIGRRLRARVFEQHLEVYHGAEPIAQITRPTGRRSVIDYRHVIEALLRKPGAFARYYYREELFPSSTYRRAYDRLVQGHGLGASELEYLRLLKLTAELGSSAIEGLLGKLLGAGAPAWRTATLRGTLCPPARVELAEPAVDLSMTRYCRRRPPMSHDPLAGLLRSFHLPTMASIYAATLQQAERHNWGYRKFLQHLCENEAEDRRQWRIARLLKQSGLPEGKSLGNLEETLLAAKIRRQLPTPHRGSQLTCRKS